VRFQNRPKPISIYLVRKDKDPAFFDEQYRYARTIHCMNCGKTLLSITAEIMSIVDTGARVDNEDMIEIWCKVCKTPFYIFP